jgi:uncharacterized protein (TIGR02598 family)
MAFSQPQDSLPLRRRSSGFTLVEVTLALGIIAFAFVALLALLPAGNNAFRRAIDLATCGQIAQRVITDAQNANFNVLTGAQGQTTFVPGHTIALPMRYFDDQGREIIPKGDTPSAAQLLSAVYYVNTRVMQTAVLPRSTERTVRAADPDKKKGEQPPLNPLAQLTVQVIHNPNGLKLELSKSQPDDVTKPDRNLVPDSRTAKMQLEIFTYSAMIGRNG